MGKGEIAHYEQFLLFPQCFQKACSPGASKGVIVWEWVKAFVLLFTNSPTQTKKAFNHNSLPNKKILGLSKLRGFVDDKISPTPMLNSVLGNIVGKGVNACFSPLRIFPKALLFRVVVKVRIAWQRVPYIKNSKTNDLVECYFTHNTNIKEQFQPR